MGTVCNLAYSVRYLVYLVVALVRAEKMTRLCDYEMMGDYGVARALKPKTMAKIKIKIKSQNADHHQFEHAIHCPDNMLCQSDRVIIVVEMIED